MGRAMYPVDEEHSLPDGWRYVDDVQVGDRLFAVVEAEHLPGEPDKPARFKSYAALMAEHGPEGGWPTKAAE